jgi:oxygen-independent coproporphyrinogen-3 oxidase
VDLLGLGPSAISELGRLYAQSFRELEPWAEAVAGGGLATFRGHRLSDEDLARRFAISCIMCAGTLSAAELDRRFPGEAPFARRFARELWRLEPLAHDGLVEILADGSVQVTPLGRLLVRHVAAAFDAYLEEPQQDGRPRFSQGV